MKKEFTFDEAKEIINYALTQFYLNDQALVRPYDDIKKAVSENCMLFLSAGICMSMCEVRKNLHR